MVVATVVPEWLVRRILARLPFVEPLPAEDEAESVSGSQPTGDGPGERAPLDDDRGDAEPGHDPAGASGPTDSPGTTDDAASDGESAQDETTEAEAASTESGRHTPPPGLAPAVGMFFNGVLAAAIRSPADAGEDSADAETDQTDAEIDPPDSEAD